MIRYLVGFEGGYEEFYESSSVHQLYEELRGKEIVFIREVGEDDDSEVTNNH